MWPGSNLPYANTTCTFSEPYNSSIPWEDRVDKAIAWFTDPKTPVNLVMMYFEEPDKHGHAYSPDSEVVSFFLAKNYNFTQKKKINFYTGKFTNLQITNIVEKLDNLTKYIHEKLAAQKLIDRVNVVHVSDHGMSSVASPNFIDFTKWLENGTYEVYGSSPVLQVVPIAGIYILIYIDL